MELIPAKEKEQLLAYNEAILNRLRKINLRKQCRFY